MIQRIQTLYLLIVTALMAVTLFAPLAWFAGDAGEFGLYAFALKTAEGEAVQPAVYMGTVLALACALPLVTIFLFRRRLLQIRLCVVEIVLLLGCVAMEGVYSFPTWRSTRRDSSPPLHCRWSACCSHTWRPGLFSATNCWCARPTESVDLSASDWTRGVPKGAFRVFLSPANEARGEKRDKMDRYGY